MQAKSLASADSNTDIRQLISSESRSYGLAISEGKSIRWTCVSVWDYSKYQGSVKLLRGIVLWMQSPIWHSPGRWQSELTGLIMAKISPSKRGTWCDYCKMRWSVNDVRGQAQAVWTITSFVHKKVIERHYCFSCAKEAQTWHDGTIWSFKEQLEYREGKQTLDVQFE